MVADRSFIIDATFLLDDAEKAFLGAAPLVDYQGRNSSVVYGAVRDMLRLRKVLGIAMGIVLVGADSVEVSTAPNIGSFLQCLQALGTYVLHEPKVRVGVLCRSILQDREGRWIVTRNKSLMQLVGSRCGVILAPEGAASEVVTTETLAARFSLRPEQVPSFLALTDANLSAPLTTKQALRLLEVCGTLDASFERSADGATSAKITRHLAANRAALLERLRELTVGVASLRSVPNAPLVKTDDACIRTFKAYGFPSLERLLGSPERVELIADVRDCRETYVAVVDRAGLRHLKNAVEGAEVCAVDTESTDKDPRRASLLGIALAVRERHAFYVPVTQPDLRDVSVASVLTVLRGLFARSVKVVGHNLKYDYVLLRRYNIRIAVPYFDTMLAAHECFGDWDFFNLGAVAKRVIGRDVKRYRDLVDEGHTLSSLPFKDLVEHGCADVDATLRLYGRLRAMLVERGIEEQFANEVMPLMRLLGDKECDGVRVDVRAIARMRDTVAKEAEASKTSIFAVAGTQFDVDSMKDVATILRRNEGVRERMRRHGLRQGQLEQLAQENDLARKIVQYGRIRKQIKLLDAICNGAKNGKVFPIFSQMKASHGRISSSDPKLVDSQGALHVSAVLDPDIRRLTPDEARALDSLQALTGDRTLESDRRARRREFIGDEDPSLAGLDHADVLISIAVGLSNAALSKRFLIDARRASVLREKITARYSKLFAWLDQYRRSVMSAGFAASGTRRKYWDGLGSSDLERRNKAVRSAVRWLIEM
jgi:DNA polymerase I-like protein with 3'-5' exonuclease and polymerase domains